MDFKGYELANDSEDSVPDGSLEYISTKYEVFLIKYMNIYSFTTMIKRRINCQNSIV